MRPGYDLPDFTQPVDVEGFRAKIPDDATSKGMYLEASAKRIRSLGGEPVIKGSFVAFKDYPARDSFDLLIQLARVEYPGTPLREALRRVGRTAYDDLVSSLVGRVIFGVLGHDIVAITKLASKAYAISGKPQSATVLEVGTNHSLIRLENIYMFIDCYQVGVFEGVVSACKRRGAVRVKMLSPTSGELYTEWE